METESLEEEGVGEEEEKKEEEEMLVPKNK
jgi:hypothetical protein